MDHGLTNEDGLIVDGLITDGLIADGWIVNGSIMDESIADALELCWVHFEIISGSFWYGF